MHHTPHAIASNVLAFKKVSFEIAQNMSSSMMNASFDDSFRTFTELALVQFIKVYSDVLKENNAHGPSPGELHAWMHEAILGESVSIEKSRNDTPINKEDVSEHSDNDDALPQPAHQQQEVSTKLEAKELKKFTYSTKKTKKSKDENGNEIEQEVDVEVPLELPYLPHCVDYSKCCQALKVNGGLITPCLTRPAKDSQFCRTCVKDLKYGTIQDREQFPVGCFTTKQGKREISYGTWLQKRNIERSFIEGLLNEKFGDVVTIPESYYSVEKTRAKRTVKKSPSASSDDDNSSVENETIDTEKKRGRPAKAVKTIIEDITIDEKDDETKNHILDKQDENDQHKENKMDADETDEDGMTYITFNGKKYVYDEENTLFDAESLDIVGSWDPEENKPVFEDE